MFPLQLVWDNCELAGNGGDVTYLIRIDCNQRRKAALDHQSQRNFQLPAEIFSTSRVSSSLVNEIIKQDRYASSKLLSGALLVLYNRHA